MRMMAGMADERGAIVALVAVMLVAILGITALVIDVGGALVTKRYLVAAADSASLAAAQACAKEEADPASKANEYAAANLAEATGAVTPVGCETPESGGTVAVTYNADHELYFANFVPGVGNTVSVDASATAMWGPGLSAEPMPLALNLTAHPKVACTDSCALWLDPSNDEALAGGEAGLVDLSRWDGGRCRGGGSSLDRVIGWISGARRSVEVTAPASPCTVTSNGDDDDDDAPLLEALRGQIGQDRLYGVAGDGSSVSGFAPLRIVNALLGDPGGSDTCPADPDEFSFSPEPPNNTLDISGDVLACELASSTPTTPATVTVELSKGDSCCSENVDYSITNNVITWLTKETKDVGIEISWTRAPDSGGCGERDGNGICLVLSWEGPRVGGSKPAEDGLAPDYGYRAVRLKD